MLELVKLWYNSKWVFSNYGPSWVKHRTGWWSTLLFVFLGKLMLKKKKFLIWSGIYLFSNWVYLFVSMCTCFGSWYFVIYWMNNGIGFSIKRYMRMICLWSTGSNFHIVVRNWNWLKSLVVIGTYFTFGLFKFLTKMNTWKKVCIFYFV